MPPKLEITPTRAAIANMGAVAESTVSRFDPSRPTVGQIYLDAQKNQTPILVGDMSNELTASLVEDLNDAMLSDPFNGRPFYVMVYEKRDRQMKNAILRRLYKTLYRPYPEDDTVVFHINPANQETRFCWCLPHWSEMDNMLINQHLWDPQMIYSIKQWKADRLESFGFYRNEQGHWRPNPKHVDELLS